jgi:hypothetical protein
MGTSTMILTSKHEIPWTQAGADLAVQVCEEGRKDSRQVVDAER